MGYDVVFPRFHTVSYEVVYILLCKRPSIIIRLKEFNGNSVSLLLCRD